MKVQEVMYSVRLHVCACVCAYLHDTRVRWYISVVRVVIYCGQIKRRRRSILKALAMQHFARMYMFMHLYMYVHIHMHKYVHRFMSVVSICSHHGKIEQRLS